MRRALGATLWLAVSACRPTGGTPSGFTLLFFDHSPAAALAGRSWVPLPDSSRLVAFDPQLRIVRTLTDPRLNTPVGVVPYRGRDLLVTEFTGAGVVVDTAGRVLREWPGPFTASLYTAGGGHVLASRSPYFVQPLAPESPTAPLVQLLDSAGRPTDGLGQLHVPDSPFLLGPTNAGALAADAPPATAQSPGREPFTPAFALPALGGVVGDTVPLGHFAGRVTLVNFWASWCDPCREEFPLMAALYGEFDRKDFEIAAISDDVNAGKMRAFVAQFRPPFPILVGGGRMRATYHYRGLPYSRSEEHTSELQSRSDL